MGNGLYAPHPGYSVEKDPEVTHIWAQWERVLSSTPHIFKTCALPFSSVSQLYSERSHLSPCVSLTWMLQRSVNW